MLRRILTIAELLMLAVFAALLGFLLVIDAQSNGINAFTILGLTCGVVFVFAPQIDSKIGLDAMVKSLIFKRR